MLGSAMLLAVTLDLASLSFMSGCWTADTRSGRVEEHWSVPAGGVMLGYSRTLKGDKLAFQEFIRIEQTDAGITYTPRVGSAPKVVVFRLVQLTDSEAVFENLHHDFPQRVVYGRGPDGKTMRARIEGTVQGKLRTASFPYSRVPCEAGSRAGQN